MSKSRDIADSAATINYIDGLTSDAQSQIDDKATLDGSPTFTGTVTAAAFSGDGSALTGVDSLPDQTGNAGKYLTTDGADSSWAEVSSSPTLEAVASGSLANGDLVSVNSDGTVSVVEGNSTYSVTSGPNISSTFLEGNNIYASAYDPVQGKVVLIYNSVNSSRYGTAIVGTISGTTLTFGTPVTFWSTSGFQTQNIIYEPSSGKMVVVGYTGTGYGLTAIVGTVSGTSISFGTPNSFGYKPDFGSYAPGICLTGTANQVFITWSGGDYPYALFGAVGTISGTSISFGTSAITSSGQRSFIDCDYDPVNNKILATFKENDNSSYGSACVVTISGTTVTYGTIATFNSNTTQPTKVMYHPPSGKMLIVYSYNALRAKAATISGTSVTYGAESTVYSSAPSYLTKNQGGFVGGGCYFSYTGVGSDGYLSKLGIEGTTVVKLEPEYEFETTSFTLGCMAYDTVNNKIATFRYGNPSETDVITPVFTTNTSFIGISNGAYSNGATATIQILGSVDDAQSGLMAGQSYYVGPEGNLTSSETSVYAGKAISSTQIIIKG